MRIWINLLIVCVAAGLGLVGGQLMRAKSTVTFTPSPTLNGATPTGGIRFARAVRKTNEIIDDSPLATQLARDLSMSAGVTRWLHWLEAIEKAQPSDFPRLARLAQNDSRTMHLLAARWAEVAPRHLLDYLVAHPASRNSGLANTLIDEWTKADPAAVFATFSDTNYSAFSKSWRFQLSNALLKGDVEIGLRALSEWNIHDYGPSMSAVRKWAAKDPRHAAEFALAHPAGNASDYVMETIGKEWAKTDPAAALSFATSSRNALTTKLASAALNEWASSDLNGAAAWLARTDPATRNRLSASFVEAWGKNDALAALTWCEANLTGSTLAQAAGSALRGAVAKDVRSAAALVTAMPPSIARPEAAFAVARKMFPQFGSASESVSSEAMTWVRGLDPESRKKVIESVHWQWSSADPKGAAAFVNTLGADSVPERAYSTIARNLARNEPAAAIEWASRVPDSQRMTATKAAFDEWQNYQGEAARNWLLDLPSKDPRREPLVEHAISTFAHGPNAFEHFAALGPQDRATAQKVLERMSLEEERKARLLEALKAQ